VNGIAGNARPPSASAMALVTAHKAPVVHASPMPFTPSGLLAAGHLGLAGLRQRVERTGWRLEVASSRGHGTCVRVRLPAIGGIA